MFGGLDSRERADGGLVPRVMRANMNSAMASIAQAAYSFSPLLKVTLWGVRATVTG